METITDTTWLRPLTVNDWGAERTYLVPPDKTDADFKSNHGTWGFDSLRGHPEIKSGTYRVRWPDGTEEVAVVQVRRVRGSVGDMGHTYETTSRVPYVIRAYHGAQLKARLDELPGVLVALLPPE
jgi:hypothetical protein